MVVAASPPSADTSVLDRADGEDLANATVLSAHAVGRLQKVFGLLRRGHIEAAISEAMEDPSVTRGRKSPADWHFLVRTGTRFRSFARSYGHAGAARSARKIAEMALLHERDRAEAQNRLGLALSTCGELTGNTHLHRAAMAAYQKAILEETASQGRPEMNNRFLFNLYSSLLSSSPTSVELAQAIPKVESILNNSDVVEDYRIGLLIILFSLWTRLAPDRTILKAHGRSFTDYLEPLIDEAVSHVASESALRPDVLRAAAQTYAAFDEIEKSQKYADQALLSLETSRTGTFPMAKLLYSRALVKIQGSLDALVMQRDTAPMICHQSLTDFGRAFGLIKPYYAPEFWCNLHSNVADRLFGVLSYVRQFPGSETEKCEALIAAFFTSYNLNAYSTLEMNVQIHSSGIFSGMGYVKADVISQVRELLLKEGVPVSDWNRVLHLIVSGVSKEEPTSLSKDEPTSHSYDVGGSYHAQSSRRRRSSSDAKDPLPKLPDGYSWPVGDYGDSPEAKGKAPGGIIAYLRQVWLPILEAGRLDGFIYVDRRNIAQHYPGVITAMKNYTRTKRLNGILVKLKIPPELLFPVESAVNDHIIGSDTVKGIRREPRLAGIIASRFRSGRRSPGT